MLAIGALPRAGPPRLSSFGSIQSFPPKSSSGRPEKGAVQPAAIHRLLAASRLTGRLTGFALRLPVIVAMVGIAHPPRRHRQVALFVIRPSLLQLLPHVALAQLCEFADQLFAQRLDVAC